MDTIMFAHTLRITALAALVMGMTAAAPIHAGTEMSRTEYLTFSRPVALPGVALRAGTYIFEMAEPEAAQDVVRVMSRDRRIVYFSAFTRQVNRPARIPLKELVSLREASPDQPMPITVWWSDPGMGRQFIYAQ
jgi:hypothetical protein